MACGASVNGPVDGLQVGSISDAAEIGTAVHDAAEQMVKAGGTLPDLDTVANAHKLEGKEKEDFKYLCFQASKFWKQYGSQFPDPQTEVEIIQTVASTDSAIPDWTLSGHLDVQAFVRREDGSPLKVIVHDWKSTDRKSTRLNSSHVRTSRMPSSA
jgi:hypothetical protein